MSAVIDMYSHSMLDDDSVHGDELPRDVVIRNYLEPIKKYLQQYTATEIWINQPGELIFQTPTGDIFVHDSLFTYDYLEGLVQAAAIYSPQQQSVSSKTPILSATLPDGERIQVVLPPAVEQGKISIAIRIPGGRIIPLEEYRDTGALSHFIWPRPKSFDEAVLSLTEEDKRLAKLLHAKNLYSFLISAIHYKKNIGVIGDTGSGKTMLMKSLCQFIPKHERLISVEDVRELLLPAHKNSAHLLYSKSGQGVAKVTPADLIASLMRMSPSRALLAELRGSEAWDFLKLLTTGHSGSITSWHAESCALGSERFAFMVKENPEAATLARSEVQHLFKLTIDVMLHMTRRPVYDAQGKQIGYERYVDEVYFDPWAKFRARFGDRDI